MNTIEEVMKAKVEKLSLEICEVVSQIQNLKPSEAEKIADLLVKEQELRTEMTGLEKKIIEASLSSQQTPPGSPASGRL